MIYILGMQVEKKEDEGGGGLKRYLGNKWDFHFALYVKKSN